MKKKPSIAMRCYDEKTINEVGALQKPSFLSSRVAAHA